MHVLSDPKRIQHGLGTPVTRDRRGTPPSRGFTLVEMLAAMALTAVLMLAVLQVLGTLGRSRSAMERQAAAAAPCART